MRRSLELYMEAAELWRQLGVTSRRSAALRCASQQRLMLGDTEEAFALLLTASQLDEPSEDISGKVQTLSLLSRVALQLGRHRECRTYYRQALALAAQTDDPAALGEAYYSAGRYLYEDQAVDKVIEFCERALEQFRRAGDKTREAEVLTEQSYAYIMRRDLQAGVEFARQALEISEQTDDRRGRVSALIAIGNANITMGESRTAFDAYQRADRLAPGELDHTKKGQIANGLGSLYEKYGEWGQSLNYREKALQLYRAEKNKPGQLFTLVSLGKLSNLNHDYEAAINYLAEGERIARELDDRFGLAQIRIEQGYISFTRGHNDFARDYYRRALRIFERLNDRLYVALVRSYLGEVEEAAGNLSASAAHYKAALKLNRDVKSRFAEADALYDLARLNAIQDRLDDSLQLIQESLQISETLRGGAASHRLRTSYFSELHERFEFHIGLLMRLHRRDPSAGYDARALQASERARARTLLDTLRMAGADLSPGADAALVEREKRVRIKLTLKSDEMTDLLNRSNAQAGAVNQLKNEIDNLSAEYEQVKASLREESLQYRTLAEPGEFDLIEFQNSILDDATLLVEFFLGMDQSYLWLVSKNDVSSYVLPPQGVIEEKVNLLLDLLINRDIRPGEELEGYQRRLAAASQQYWLKAQELSNLLFSQAADKIEKKRLVLVVDKSLHYFPLAALPKPRSDATQASHGPMVLDHEIIHQPSANALLMLEKKPARPSSAKTLLVFADPIFSADDGRLIDLLSREMNSAGTESPLTPGDITTRGRFFVRLWATQREAELILSHLTSNQSTILTGATASRENLLRTNFADYKIVHFATHGLYEEAHPELSGIILSQFDKNGNPQNGHLRLSDIYQLSMPVDLVVLSACSSGRGKIVKGEGIVGLTRGFMQAGSRSVLSSLWKVDDAATAELMNYYYKALLAEKLTPAGALRQAQIKMWQDPQWESPFYWAAFNLHGDFRHHISPASKPVSPAYLAWCVCTALFVGLILLLRKRLLMAAANRHLKR